MSDSRSLGRYGTTRSSKNTLLGRLGHLPPGVAFDEFKQHVRDPLVLEVLGLVGGCRREVAEEAVDAAITVVWQRMAQDVRITHPGAYVVKVAIRAVLKHIEAERRMRPAEDMAETEDSSATESFQQVELHMDLQHAMRYLTPRTRTILMLHLAGKSYEEIAVATKIRPGTVGSHLNRARSTLRRLLDGWEER